MIRSRVVRVALLALALSAPSTAVLAQASAPAAPTTQAYDTAALRVRHGFFRTSVVRGPEDALVAHVGFGTPPVRDLFARSEAATDSFERFSREHARSSWMGLLGGIGFVGGLVAGARGDDRLAAVLSVGGTVFSMGSGIFRTRADEHLSRAVWWYNASLLREPAPGSRP